MSRRLCAACLLAVLVVTACGEPPNKEMDQAQGAIDAARAAGADRYATAMAEPGALTGALNWYRGIPFSTKPPLGRITVPTTYIWGRQDVALARAAAELTADYVVGPYEAVELAAGHWLPETEPDAVADAILARVRST